MKCIDELPSEIKIGSYTIPIIHGLATETYLRAHTAWAMWDANEYTILVRSDFPNKELAVSSLIHEITHACFTVFGMGSENLVEEQVCLINDMIWVTVFKDNPWLLKWIGKTLA